MKPLRRLAAFFAVLFSLSSAPAFASSYSVDFTDLWFTSTESGWGLNVIQQGNTLFATLFVYGNDQSARWYVASGMAPVTAGAGQSKFSGKLYQTSGPFFGAASFNPSQVQVTEVGTMTLTFTTSNTAVLEYNVNATTVTKNVTRQTFVLNSPAGAYQGGMDTITSSCVSSGNNGALATFLGFVVVNVNAQNQVAMTMNYLLGTQQATCQFTNATYSQQGRLGAITGGNWTCAQGTTTLNNGTFSITNLEVHVTGISGTITAVDQFCSYAGRFGGMRTANN